MDFLTSWIYVICVIVGVFLAIVVSLKEAKRLGVSTAHVKGSLVVGIPVAIVGARIVYALCNWAAVTEGYLGFSHVFSALLAVNDGGLNAFGGLVFGLVFALIVCKKQKINFFKVLDILVPAILIAQISAGFGSLLTSLFGGAGMSLGLLAAFMPTLWLGLGLAAVLVLRRLRTKLQIGTLFGMYLVWAGVASVFMVGVFGSFNASLVLSIILLVAGGAYLVVTLLKLEQPTYFNELNEIDETGLQCFVFDLDQTIIKADKLVNTAYGDAISKAHGLSVYDDPQIALSGDKLKRYVQFTKENHELLSETYRGVEYTLGEIQKVTKEIIIISKLPADLIAIKLHHFGLGKYVSRFINSNDIAKLGKQYNPSSVVVLSSDRKVLNFSTRNGYRTAYSKFANEDTTGVVADVVLNKFVDSMYLV